ncbi:MAG: dihydroxyacetone kinase subunit DhaK [Methylobacterium sp.]|nr:dihydroxyacetone kinase subunit DhaK [Methylobacterium sp.]MCA3652477.1 dihydroxyacetone kinase subunit DhaK [Methylobacterium sp.]MCA4921365.1 dihydroxyacetone kinase subunit DhaK [Methylobacterium sp.]
MTHFFNTRDTIVTEALDGLLLSRSPGQIARLDGYPSIKVICRADRDRSKVAVISGGGAGHEPSHAGFIGQGMLTAAVSGEIFASPSVDAVLAAIRAVTGAPGCLLIVKNYTGDRLNFGLAAERARAEGYRVEMVIVADDIAIPDNPRPRGVAGTLFVHKIAGYWAETGADLATVAAEAKAAAGASLSIGASLSSCSIPGQIFHERLSPGEGELGLGIHGEPGIERFTMASAAQLVETMLGRLREALPSSGPLALMLNNLGAVPPLEMSLIARQILQSWIAPRVRLLIGPAPLMTALNMNGFSISLIALDEAREAALLAPVGAPAWPGANPPGVIEVWPLVQAPSTGKAEPASAHETTERILRLVCERLIGMEAELNALDARVGDGDTGSTLATGARSVLGEIAGYPLDDPAGTASAIGRALGTSMGGSSGVLLSIFFTATAGALQSGLTLAPALRAGLDRVMFYGGARPGDRTMIDALAPALAAFEEGGLAAASRAARIGADLTGAMQKARAGRSAYLAAQDLEGAPDPGAMAVAAVFDVLETV